MDTCHDEYCIACGSEQISHEHRRQEFKVRSEILLIEVPVRVCDDCGTFNAEDGVDPALIAFAEYRRKFGEEKARGLPAT